MTTRNLATPAAVLAIALIAACQTTSRAVKAPPLGSEGEVWVYLAELPAQAERLRFGVQSVVATRADGQEYPLGVVLSEVGGAGERRQRLVATGRVPPGDFTGVAVRAGKATLAGDDGAPANLLVPDEPSRVPVPFQVGKGRARVVSLALDVGRSIDKGFNFRPVFAGVVPPLPIVDLLGFVTASGSASVTVFDKKARQVVAVLPTGRSPAGLAMDRLLSRLYVALEGSDEVAAYDLVTGDEVGRARLQPGDRPREVALAADGRTLVVTCSGSNAVALVDPAGLVEVGRVRAGLQPTALLVDRSGRRAYAFNQGSSSITVVDVAARGSAGAIVTDGAPARGALNRAGDRLYVVTPTSAYMSVFAIPTLARANQVFVGFGAESVHVDPRTDYVYVAMGDTGQLQLFAPLAPLPVGRIELPGPATWLCIDDVYDVLLGVVPASHGLTGMELTSRKVLPLVDVGVEPYAAAVFGERR